QSLLFGLRRQRGRGMTRREGGKPYAVWRDFVRQLCLETPPDEAEAAVLRATFSDIEPLLPMAGTPAPALPPKAEQQRLVRTIEALLRRVTRPLVVLLEDLHWDLGESRGVLH